MTVLSQDLGLEKARLHEDFKACYAAVSSEAQEPFPGVVDLCAWVCDHGGQNFVITHRGRDSLLDLLRAHGMSDYFTDWITADDEYPRKPDPATFEVLIQRHHLVSAGHLAIGDREIDMIAAQARGLRTCFFETTVVGSC
jgi:phosphoglycolate phosphatase-like HAD superfamily hydrolase